MEPNLQNSINKTDNNTNLSAGASTPKNRIQRYCPRLKDIKLELECEWDNCKEVYSDMDEFMDHIDRHLEMRKSLDCKWRMCDSDEIEFDEDLKRHVIFHAFHSKLKQIGRSILYFFLLKQKIVLYKILFMFPSKE